MLRCFPRRRRVGRWALPWAMTMAALGAGPAAASAALSAAQLELAAWIGGLETAPAGSAAATAFPQAETWLAAPAAGPDREFARALCRPRYVALTALGDTLAARQAAGDRAGAAALYHGRILPTCFEIAVCLSAAADAGERP